MSHATPAPRVDLLLARLDGWAARGTVRALLIKLGVSVAGPLVILAGVAMLVLPGPGLVVIAGGFALLALEYPWARRVVALGGRTLARLRDATLPKGGSPGRRALGVAAIAGFAVAGFAATTAITGFLGAQALL